MKLLLLLGSCCSGREFVTEYSDPFLHIHSIIQKVLCQKFLVSKTLFVTLIKLLSSLHVPEYFRDYQQITFVMLNRFFDC